MSTGHERVERLSSISSSKRDPYLETLILILCFTVWSKGQAKVRFEIECKSYIPHKPQICHKLWVHLLHSKAQGLHLLEPKWFRSVEELETGTMRNRGAVAPVFCILLSPHHVSYQGCGLHRETAELSAVHTPSCPLRNSVMLLHQYKWLRWSEVIGG